MRHTVDASGPAKTAPCEERFPARCQPLRHRTFATGIQRNGTGSMSHKVGQVAGR